MVAKKKKVKVAKVAKKKKAVSKKKEEVSQAPGKVLAPSLCFHLNAFP